MKTTMITVWFDMLPPYLDKFIERCNAQGENWKFLLFNNMELNMVKGNFHAIHQSKDDFADRCRNRIGCEPVTMTPEDRRKIVDTRPLFGDIFIDYLDDADNWAYGETDVVYGKLDNFLTPRIMQSCDVFSVGKWMSSNLSVFHNDGKNQMYRLHPQWKHFVTDSKLHGFDERTISQCFEVCGVNCLYWYAHAHDAQPWHLPRHKLMWGGDQLYDMGAPRGMREIMMYHFPVTDTWPEIPNADKG